MLVALALKNGAPLEFMDVESDAAVIVTRIFPTARPVTTPEAPAAEVVYRCERFRRTRVVTKHANGDTVRIYEEV